MSAPKARPAITYGDIETIDDARAWLSAQRSVTRERLHMLQQQFDEHRDELSLLVEQRGITLTGEPGM